MKQLEFARTRGWGGRRRGAGRPNRSGEVSHGKRLRVTGRTPLHITLRLCAGVGSLHVAKLFYEFNSGLVGARRFGLRVNHFSLMNNHVHMIVEADDNLSLATGLKSLLCRFAKKVRARYPGKGGVFAGRYHMHVLKTPREMRNALEYVLLNQAKHGRRLYDLDRYSSAQYFTEWGRLLGKKFEPLLRDQLRELRSDGPFKIGISPPRSWLGLKGWSLA